MLAVGAVGMFAGTGATARFTADSEGSPAPMPAFCTTTGYRPGTARAPAGIGTDNCRLLFRLGTTGPPLKETVLAARVKNPPVSCKLALPEFCDTLSGEEATIAGRTGPIVSARGPGAL